VIRVPGDKSISHRALILASLSDGESRLEGVLPGQDCRSTAAVLRNLGARIPELPPDGQPMSVHGSGLRGLVGHGQILDCGNSGTTARLLLGLLAGLGAEARLTGDASLRSRPMARVTDPLRRVGARFVEEGEGGRLPIRILPGRLGAIRHTSHVASAQVKSALLLAGLAAGVSVEVEEPFPSRDHSERLLRRTGITVKEDGWAPHRVSLVDPPFRLRPFEIRVPGDVSSAAFFLVLGALLGVETEVANVGLNPTRTGVLDALERMGVRIRRENVRELEDPAGEPAGDLTTVPEVLRAVEIGGAEIPSLIDEIPILAVAAARAEGTTVIRDASELRVKESDRIAVLAGNLAQVGVRIRELPDGLEIQGSDRPLEGRVQAHGDHRIAMAFGVLGAVPGNRIQVDDPWVADVSFPGFWDILRRFAQEGGPAERRPEPGAGPEDAPPPGQSPDNQVITIDGPAGSGKSSTARAVARRLGLRHLDSGALYRAATLALLDSGIPDDEWEGRGLDHLRKRRLGLRSVASGFEATLDGAIPGVALRSDRVNAKVSRVAALPGVRDLLLPVLREAGEEGGIVADGRDMGSVVFPGADLKVYLTADLEERARRRLLEEGGEVSPEEVVEAARRLATRDAEDRERTAAPLRRPEDALVVDTTELEFEEQVERIVGTARRLAGRSPASDPL
jgi:3-phosphoshikimate 1-carboxyvinyltransferase